MIKSLTAHSTNLASNLQLSVTVFLVMHGGMVIAQPNREVTQLLFEPVPLALAESNPTITLTSFSAAESEIPVAVSDLPAYTDEELDQMQEDIKRYLLKVGDMESLEGPYSNELREDLFTTGNLYQQIEDHENAVRMYERALAVSRINFGLEGLDQVPIMEAMARSYNAQEKTTDADAMMVAAFNLQQKVYGANSVEMIDSQIRLADWDTQAFMDRSSILVNIPRMNVQNFLMDPKNYIQGTQDMRNTPVYKLYEARGLYLNAIKTLVDAKAFAHPQIMNLEHKLLTNYFLHMHRENILYEPDFYLTRKKTKTATRLNQNAIELMNSENYDLGQEAHKRRMIYLQSNEARTSEEVATAMLEEADWDLLFERKTNAADKYDAAYAFFVANPNFQAEANDAIYPTIPVVLPTYLPPPNSRAKLGIAPDAKVNFFGYIDVNFSITKFGKARRVKILGTGGEVTRNMEIRMNQYLRNVLFRPRYINSEVDTSDISLRYYIGV
jgi:tetratricopeptide (TPR) repeat protein